VPAVSTHIRVVLIVQGVVQVADKKGGPQSQEHSQEVGASPGLRCHACVPGIEGLFLSLIMGTVSEPLAGSKLLRMRV
jgi:hypothetical protein